MVGRPAMLLMLVLLFTTGSDAARTKSRKEESQQQKGADHLRVEIDGGGTAAQRMASPAAAPMVPPPEPAAPPAPPSRGFAAPFTREELDEALLARKAERKGHADRAKSLLAEGRYANAVGAYTAAIMTTVASSHVAAVRLAMSDRWKPGDDRRLEVAALYAGRAHAQIKQHGWGKALYDAHAASVLAPNASFSLSLFAEASAGLAAMPQEPVPFFADDPMPGQGKAEAAAAAQRMTAQLAHGLVAEVSACGTPPIGLWVPPLTCQGCSPPSYGRPSRCSLRLPTSIRAPTRSSVRWPCASTTQRAPTVSCTLWASGCQPTRNRARRQHQEPTSSSRAS
jgi:hypothetical protein